MKNPFKYVENASNGDDTERLDRDRSKTAWACRCLCTEHLKMARKNMLRHDKNELFIGIR